MATTSSSTDKKAIRAGVWIFGIAICWTILIAILAGWDYRKSCSSIMAIAQSTAIDSFNRELLYRRWASLHGSVYVPITAEMPPDASLAHMPDRDITTPSGIKLTLVNPVYISHQTRELKNNVKSVEGHITSLKPLGSENSPDEWEKNALLAFERGEKAVSSVEVIDKERYLRLMRPMFVDQGCLKCHGAQGYKMGEIRGGISIAVPWTPFQEALNDKFSKILTIYSGIWAVGILGMYILLKRLGRHLSNLKQTENALRESESLQCTLLENLPAGVVIVNPRTRVIENVNPFMAALFGAPEHQIVGHKCHRFLCPNESGNCPVCNLNKDVDNTEQVMLRADGSRIPILKSVTKFWFNGEEKLLETFVDLTERKQVEKTILESENKYHGLFEHSHDAITIIEPPFWKYSSANPAAVKMFQAKDEDHLLALGPSELSPEHQPDGRNSAEKAEEMCETALHNGYHCFEWMHKRLDGEEFPASVTLSRIMRGGNNFIQATVRDISEIKEAEKQINQTRANYESFFNRINDFLFVMDKAGNIIHTNAQVNIRLGYAEEELVGKSILLVFPPECRTDAKLIVGEMLAGETDFCAVPLMAKSGERISVETRVSWGFWDDKTVLFGVSKDITQVKRSEEMFAKAFHSNSVIMSLSRLEDGTFIDANDTFLKASGYSRAELIGSKAIDLGLYAVAEQRKIIAEKLKQHGSIKEEEVAVRTKDGAVRDCLISADTIRVGKELCMLSVIVDVTDRKEMERRQNLTSKILEILNDRSLMTDTTSCVLAEIQQAIGFDAVGIRLQKGNDFPYFSQQGFSSDFLNTENSLIAHGQNGEPCRDQNGNCSLECMCGLVISGHVDSSNPLFTVNGSFWTNDTLPLLDIPASLDFRNHPRNRCINEGFRSIALVPIRATHEVVGLLQLNSRKKDYFTLDMIQFFEGICSSVGAALERKRAEDALRESEEKFRNYVDHSFDIIFTLDDNGTFLFISPVFKLHFGYPVSDIIGQPFPVVVHQEDVPNCETLLNRLLATGQGETSAPIRIKHADGDWRWIEANITHFVNAKGEGEFLGIARDISERKSTEEQLRNYAAALESNNKSLEEFNRLSEAATRAKSEFLANMSHEIRTPMTAILGCADLLINEKGLEKAPPQRRKNIETIKRNGEHLLGLINDILDLSKIEAGKMKIGSTRCSPFELIGDVVSLMQVRAEAKQLRFETDLVEPLPETVLTDPLRLRQVLINLVGNAIKFTDRGKICISARLTNDNGKPRLRFDVTDTGIGMNDEQVGKLFQAFSQVDSSAVRKFSGTGLGLCIGKRLAEAMGGNIEVHSTPGVGSTFSFTIDPGPLEGIKMIQYDQSSESELTPASGADVEIKLDCRVLLAEDGPDNQRLISIMLEDAGANVTMVDNGQLAVEAALAAVEKHEPFSVILMDMQMPVMDGYTATRELRMRGYTAPVIALTAHAMSDDRQKCLDAGCDDFVSKPIDWQMLLTTVDRWATKGSAGKSAEHNDDPALAAKEAEELLYSNLAAKPVIARILPEFVSNLDARVKAMRDALASGQFDDLRRLAHQLKGAGGSYGYPSITEAAKSLETDAREGWVIAAQASLEKVAALCRAAVRGFEAQQKPTPEHSVN